MAALIPKYYFLAAKKQLCAATAIVQSFQYSQRPRIIKNPTPTSLKRGRGGRSSFNGIVCTVFGNSGFIGRYLVQRLGKIGTQIILPHRCDFYDVQSMKICGDLGQVLFHPFDLRDEDSILRSIKYSNVVVNLIGREYETKNFTYKDVNVEGAATLAKLAKQSGVERFIHFSCLKAHPEPEPVVIEGGSKYHKSKWEGEWAVKREFPEATIIRPSDVYGTEDRFLAALSHDWRLHFRGLPLHKMGEGTEKQPIYVGDVVSGVVKIIKDPNTAGRTYQFVGPSRYKLSELVDWIHRHVRHECDNWGFRRMDLDWSPLFKLKIALTEMISPAYPLGYLHWEEIEKEATSDRILKGVPTLEDLGVKLTPTETQLPWELKPHTRNGSYHYETLGEVPIINPPTPLKPKFYESNYPEFSH